MGDNLILYYIYRTWLKVTAPYEFIEAKCIKFGRGTIFKVII